ncbi:MAG: hypothetical protein LC102_12295 [Ignavibacteriales bacterium]|mgnify:CR=1 FL=1|nr:MAG: GAF domain-containing protein [Ignavibacteriaceae bacterium]MBW7873854.1 GAF domain-containing protein [Ignavibacteria bacterium]MCZ2144191.1 hypothetical protein [Ignavibacteriales bacterium]OQY76397.1 MAG: hypothetical protein B6D45_03610 [Ignavibacteriales bacterium UTCHB3]MBV6445830.1 hypothetical protein [Ignavibacteriaceae bacterium]
MSEAASITFTGTESKEERYRLLLAQAEHLFSPEEHWLSSFSNFTAAVKEALPYVSWVGFYFLSGGRLVLGPFQGKLACTVIQPGKGVCGKVCLTGETEIVPDVNDFPGHIACDSGSNSEIVVPLFRNVGDDGALGLSGSEVSGISKDNALDLSDDGAFGLSGRDGADFSGEDKRLMNTQTATAEMGDDNSQGTKTAAAVMVDDNSQGTKTAGTEAKYKVTGNKAEKELFGVLDLDSYQTAAFDETDKHYLEELTAILLTKATLPVV